MNYKKLSQAAVLIGLMLFLLVGCSNSTTPAPTLIPPTATIVVPATPTPPPTLTPQPTATAAPTPTATPTDIDWTQMSPLSDVVMTEEDVFSVSSYLFGESHFRENFVERHEATSELQGDCLLDCAKTVITFKAESLTIILRRAENADQAQTIVKQLRADFVGPSGQEYSLEDFGGVDDLSPNTWLIGGGSVIVLGASRGPVIVQLIWSYDLFALGICKTTEEGTYCEGDLSGLSFEVLAFAEIQFDRLSEAGYTP